MKILNIWSLILIGILISIISTPVKLEETDTTENDLTTTDDQTSTDESSTEEAGDTTTAAAVVAAAGETTSGGTDSAETAAGTSDAADDETTTADDEDASSTEAAPVPASVAAHAAAETTATEAEEEAAAASTTGADSATTSDDETTTGNEEEEASASTGEATAVGTDANEDGKITSEMTSDDESTETEAAASTNDSAATTSDNAKDDEVTTEEVTGGDSTAEATDADTTTGAEAETTTGAEAAEESTMEPPTEEAKSPEPPTEEGEEATDAETEAETTTDEATETTSDEATEAASDAATEAEETTLEPPTEEAKSPEPPTEEGEEATGEESGDATAAESSTEETPAETGEEETAATEEETTAESPVDGGEETSPEAEAESSTAEGEEAAGEGETTVETVTTENESTAMPSTEDDDGSGDSSETVTIKEDNHECTSEEFKCDNRCFSVSKRCDTVLDCSDGSDESTEACGEQSVHHPAPAPSDDLELTITPNEEEIRVKEGELLEVVCTIRGPFPNLQAVIYKDQAPLEQSDNGRVVVRVERASQADAAQYLCYGYPADDRSKYLVKSVRVVVEQGHRETHGGGHVVPHRPDQPDREERNVVRAEIDANVDLSCEFSSEEDNGLKWRKVDGELSDYSREYLGKLYVYYLQPKDSGEYECYMPDGRSARVRLVVRDPSQPEPEPRPVEPRPEERPDDRRPEEERPDDRDDRRAEEERPDEPEYAIRTYLEKTNIQFRIGHSDEQVCTGMTNGYNLDIQWVNPRGQVIRTDKDFSIVTETTAEAPLTKVSKLRILNLNAANAGSYECRVVVGRQKDSAKFDLTLEDGQVPPFKPVIQTEVCDIQEATCQNGQCIPRDVLCDGRSDCSDGSDEINCGGGAKEGRCEPNEKQCRNGKCVQKIWFCDGENDCGDNSDEDQCPKPRPGEKCQTHEYLCRSGDQCVLKGFVCDSENDCLDQSDEIGCEQPRIVRGPIRNLTVIIGGTIRIECEASGFPAPYVNWRLNWGHVCEEPRCVSTNENGRGQLTITDARLSDAGAYSCEALNSKGRLFAVPDAIVTVVDNNMPKPPRPVCNCHNHANDCDSAGNCINCLHYTTGRNCEYCISGFTGDARNGQSDDCRREVVVEECDPHGSLTRSQPCRCKPSVTGPLCNQCKEKHFGLVRNRNDHRQGCISCFCNGLPVNCRSSDLYYNKIESNFERGDEGWTVSNRTGNLRTSVTPQSGSIEFNQFYEFPDQELYFIAPDKFKGNKLASYGGNLTFTIRFEGSSSSERAKRLDLRISGTGVNLIYNYTQSYFQAYKVYKIVVPLYEENFKRYGDNGVVDREHFLMALSNIELIMIRASFISQQYSVKLSEVSLDHGQDYPDARNDPSGYNRAYPVEVCECPAGYSGSSCESCAPGYQRTTSGFYIGLCERARPQPPTDEVVITIDVPGNDLVLRPGQDHVIYVTISGGAGPARWHKEPERNLPPGVRQENNNLVITNARPDMSGRYVCTVYGPNGQVTEVIVINVPGHDDQPRQPPSIYSPNQKLTRVRVGSPFVLECIARGHPMPNLRLETPVRSGSLPEALERARERPSPQVKFEVTYFSPDNAGEYRCIAENEYGENVVERFIVNPEEDEGQPPNIRVEPKTIEATEGENLIINASYTGSEPVEVRVELYSPNNVQLTNVYVNKERKTIELKGVTRDMDGQYVITASNPFGSSNDFFYLRVLEAPRGPRIYVTETVIRTDVGTSLKIEPRVQYVGRPYFTWTKDDGPLPANVQVTGYVLYIPQVRRENEGVYALTLMDQSGTAKIQVKVIVDERQIQPTYRPETTRRPGAPRRIPVREDTEIELSPGETAHLICNLRPRTVNPRAISTTSWYRGNRAQREKFPSNIRPNQEQLQVIKFKPSDAGEYTCSVSSSDGSLQSIVIYLRVKPQDGSSSEHQPQAPRGNPPSARVGEREKSLRTGDNYEINCATSGEPEPRVVWLFNNQSNVEGLNNVYPRGNILYIRDAQPELTGLFTCRAVAEDGQFAEASTQLRVEPEAPEVDPSAQVEVTPRSASPTVGETVRFSCVLVGGSSDSVRYVWTKQNSALPGGSDADENGVLTLYNVQPQDSGVYDCEAEVLSDGSSHRGQATLNVGDDRRPAPTPHYPPDSVVPSGQALTVDVSPDVANLVQGRDAEFVCTVAGGSSSAAPVVTWKKISDSLDSTRHVIEGNNLRIANVRPEDRGYFECQADSGEETARDYVRVEVEVREAPTVEIYPQQESVEIDYGSVAYAQCRVTSGVPSPVVEWRRADGRPLSSKVTLAQEGSLLQVTDAGADEFAEYECVAKNAEGEAKGKIKIVPRGGPPVEPEESERSRPQPEEDDSARYDEEAARRRDEEERRRLEDERRRQEEASRPEQPEQPEQPEEEAAPVVIVADSVVDAEPGRKAVLRCRTTTRLPHRIDWLTPSNEYSPAESDGSLVLEDAKPGVYICVVTNQYGSSRAQVEVRIAGSPAGHGDSGHDDHGDRHQALHVTISPKSRSVAVGSSVEFVCNVQSNEREPPQTRWSRPGGAALPAYHTINDNVLTIERVEAADAGRYQCTAQTTDGSVNFDAAYLQVSRQDDAENAAFPVYIRVLEKPTDFDTQGFAFRYGVRITAECVAQSADIVDVSWSKVEGGVNRAVYDKVDNKNTMTIGGLVPMDLGTYVCIATRRDGSRAQNTIVFERHASQGNQFEYRIEGPSEPVEENPDHSRPHRPEEQPHREDEHSAGHGAGHGADSAATARILGGDQIRKAQGESVEIVCEVSGSPAPSVSWERHGGSLPEQSRVEHNRLSLFNLQASDSGYYLCFAENSLERARAHVYLEVSSGGEEHGAAHSGGDNGDRDEERERYERERQEREREEREREEREREEREREEREREEREREERERAEREREHNENEEHHENEEETTTTTHSTTSKAQKPLIYIRTLVAGRITPGSELRIACLVTDPEADLQFFRIGAPNIDGQRVKQERISESRMSGYEIVFDPFQADDVGQYRCVARNLVGESQDSAYVTKEADESFSLRIENQNKKKIAGNPHVSIAAIGSLEADNNIELKCELEDADGAQVDHYSWIRYPHLPDSAVVNGNMLEIKRFDSAGDNGIYSCRASTADDSEYYGNKLIASNDYLLGENPFFSFTKEEQDYVVVRCRPNANSIYEWMSHATNDQSGESFKIEGDDLYLYRSDVTNHFSCHLKSDHTYGEATFDLEVNRGLLDKAFEKETVNVDINGKPDAAEGEDVDLACTPGENC